MEDFVKAELYTPVVKMTSEVYKKLDEQILQLQRIQCCESWTRGKGGSESKNVRFVGSEVGSESRKVG